MTMNTCPICGGDRDKDLTEAMRALKEAGKVGGANNPGGYTFEFKDGGTLHVKRQCNACDEAIIRAYIATKATP